MVGRVPFPGLGDLLLGDLGYVVYAHLSLCQMPSVLVVCRRMRHLALQRTSSLLKSLLPLSSRPFHVPVKDLLVLEQLIVSYRNVGGSMKHLSSGLAHGALTKLACLHMESCGLGDDDVVCLAEALKSRDVLTDLVDLNMSNNRLSDVALSSLSSAAKRGGIPSLQTLTLGRNRIGDEGVKSLADTIRGGALSFLRRIFLEKNDLIGDGGATALFESLGSVETRVDTLWLGQNRIGDAGMHSFYQVAMSGAFRGLRKVSFESNRVQDEGMRRMGDLLRSGKLACLTILNCRNNPGDTKSMSWGLVHCKRLRMTL